MNIEYVRYYATESTACGCKLTPNERELAFMDLGLGFDRNPDAESVPSTVAAVVRLSGDRTHVTCMCCAGSWLERTDGKRPELMAPAESWAERIAS